MAEIRTPEDRAEKRSQEISRIRRKYRKNVRIGRKILPGEAKHVEDMVIVLRLAGYNTTQIARSIGLSLDQVKSFLESPRVTERIVDLRNSLSQAALELLQGYMIEAIHTIVDIMRMSSEDKLVLQAAGEILDRAGIVKASRQERLQVNEQRTVFTDDGIVEKLREASPEVQEQAAQLIEQMESLLTVQGKPKKKAVGE
jgi:hypothetical protein